ADMNESDLYSLGPTPPWARGLRVRPKRGGSRARLPPLVTSPTWYGRGSGRPVSDPAWGPFLENSAARDPSHASRRAVRETVRLYYVYVIEMIAIEATSDGRPRPRRRVYVGSSALSPE